MFHTHSIQEIRYLITQLTDEEASEAMRKLATIEEQNTHTSSEINPEKETKIDKIVRILSLLTPEEKKELDQEQKKIIKQQENEIKRLQNLSQKF